MLDYLCSSTEPLPSEEDDMRETGVATPPPTVVDSSCSELSEFSYQEPSKLSSQPPQSRPTPIPRAAEPASPSSICAQRKLSTAITTTPHAKHPVLEGRQTLVLPGLDSSTFTPQKTSEMLIPRSAPPKAPRSGPVRVDQKGHHRGHSAIVAAVAPAPLPNNLRKNNQKPLLHRAQSLPGEHDAAYKFRMEPHPLRLDAWSEATAENFNVRGRNYMNDRIKKPSEASAFRLLTVDLVNCEKPIYEGMCSHPNERVQLALKRERETGQRELPPFVFAVNLVIPGATVYHQVHYFGIDNMDEIMQGTTPFGRLMNKFIFGNSDEFRNKTFKLIPRIVEGNYVVRKAVGSTPSILGKKIKQYYIRGDRYFEIIVDIASDPVAQRIVKLALGYAKTLVVDIMYVLEGTHAALLPERIFGGVRMKFIDFKAKDGKRTVTSAQGS